jgi:hypothetical protein
MSIKITNRSTDFFEIMVDIQVGDVLQQFDGKPVGDAEGGAEPDSMIIQRTVRLQRGKWKMFPPEVLNRRRNAEGEWEDVPPEEQR